MPLTCAIARTAVFPSRRWVRSGGRDMRLDLTVVVFTASRTAFQLTLIGRFARRVSRPSHDRGHVITWYSRMGALGARARTTPSSSPCGAR